MAIKRVLQNAATHKLKGIYYIKCVWVYNLVHGSMDVYKCGNSMSAADYLCLISRV